MKKRLGKTKRFVSPAIPVWPVALVIIAIAVIHKCGLKIIHLDSRSILMVERLSDSPKGARLVINPIAASTATRFDQETIFPDVAFWKVVTDGKLVFPRENA